MTSFRERFPKVFYVDGDGNKQSFVPQFTLQSCAFGECKRWDECLKAQDCKLLAEWCA